MVDLYSSTTSHDVIIRGKSVEAYAKSAVLNHLLHSHKNKAKSAQKSQQSDAGRRWSAQEFLHRKLIWLDMLSLHK